MFLLSILLAIMQPSPQAQALPKHETRLVVASPNPESPDLQKLRETLGAAVVAETSAGSQVWSLPDDAVSDAFRLLVGTREVSAVDYAGPDYRTLLVDVDEGALTPQEQEHIAELSAWPGVGEVQVQRPRLGVLTRGLLTQGLGRQEGLMRDRSFLLALPGRPETVAASSEILVGADELTWSGPITMGPDQLGAGITLGEATLRAQDTTITGNFNVGDDAYVLSSVGDRGLNALFHVDAASLPPDHLDRAFGGVEPAVFREQGGELLPRRTVTVTVGVAYTQAALNRLSAAGGEMQDLIERLIEEANYGLRRSGATFNLELAGIRRLGQAETTMGPDVRALISRNDGRWDEIHAWRGSVRADLVVVVVGVTSTECGQSGAIPAAAAQAFAVVSLNCAIVTYTMAHEIGHLLGGMHVNDTETTTSPGFARGYSHGRDWRTVMAEVESCSGCGRVNHWANPQVIFRGVPAGVVGHNHDIRALNENAVIASRFQ